MASTVLLLAVGTFCMSFTLLTRQVTGIPAGPGDFLKGSGFKGPRLTLILSTLIIHQKAEIKKHNRH